MKLASAGKIDLSISLLKIEFSSDYPSSDTAPSADSFCKKVFIESLSC
jgi:hypothetical protein